MGNKQGVNNEKWLSKIEELKIDRISLLTIMGCVELAIRHPDMKGEVKTLAKYIGQGIYMHLNKKGLKLPRETRKNYEKTFY